MAIDQLSGLAPSFASAANELLAAVLDQSADCIKLISPQGNVDYMNRNGQCAMEIDDFLPLAGQAWTALWPSEARGKIEQAIKEARSGKLSRFEAYCPTAKGSPRWWEVSVSRLRRHDGQLQGFIATSRDVTDRMNEAALRDAMADEVRHRLRNNYAVVGSLLNAYSRGHPLYEDFAHEMIHRLSSLGIVQTLQAGNAPCLLSEILAKFLDAYATPQCPIIVGTMPDVALGQRRAEALAIVFGELAVNSMKHGALSSSGRVRVEGFLADGVIELTWLESSIRLVEKKHRDGGQGLRIMDRVLASCTGGIDFTWNDTGLEARVSLSAEDLVGSTGELPVTASGSGLC